MRMKNLFSSLSLKAAFFCGGTYLQKFHADNTIFRKNELLEVGVFNFFV